MSLSLYRCIKHLWNYLPLGTRQRARFCGMLCSLSRGTLSPLRGPHRSGLEHWRLFSASPRCRCSRLQWAEDRTSLTFSSLAYHLEMIFFPFQQCFLFCFVLHTIIILTLFLRHREVGRERAKKQQDLPHVLGVARPIPSTPGPDASGANSQRA